MIQFLIFLTTITISLAFPQYPIHPIKDARRLITTTPTTANWLSQQEIQLLIQRNIKFIDVTETIDWKVKYQNQRAEFPKECLHEDVIKPLFSHVSTERMIQFLTTFSSFHTRYFKSNDGKKSSTWLHQQLVNITQSARDNVKVTVKQVKHTSWEQTSSIVRIESRDSQQSDVVIVSAHQDSVNQWNPFGRSPGADDNGSGTTTLIEVLQILLDSEFVPERPVEFHWYSAEEGGLLGSGQIASSYRRDNVSVYGVLHIDMDAYSVNTTKKEQLGIVRDFTDPLLSVFLEKLIETYLQIPFVDTKCNYACSDHASWTRNGYPAILPFEGTFDMHSPFIHTENDTIEHVNWGHVHQFAQLLLGFIGEMSWSSQKQ
jgi:leucyl aminopeptidase